MKIAPRPVKKTRVEVVENPPAVELKCAECSGPMRLLRAIDSETHEVKWLFYGCVKYPECYCTHSAHADGQPMGTPANQATRSARHATHKVFDQLWKRGGQMTRAGAYKWLTEMFGQTEQIHIGNMTIEQCDKINKWSLKKLAELEAERKSALRSGKARGYFKPERAARIEDRKHRTQKLDAKQTRRYRSEPPTAAPKPEPEEEPPKVVLVCEALATG